MNRRSLLFLAVLLGLALPARADTAPMELGREILRRIPDWPQARVEIPLEVYEEYVRFTLVGPTPPQPPELIWVERAEWTVRIGQKEPVLEATLEVTGLPGEGRRAVRVLPAALAWEEVKVGGKPAEFRRDKDGWFYFDAARPGGFRITARAIIKPTVEGDRRRILLKGLVPRAAWTVGSVDSDEPWEVRFSGAPLPIVGDAKGTRGAVGLVPSDTLEITWQRPQPPVHRAAQIESQAEVGWTLGDGVHQVSAVLDLRLWGGDVSELAVSLPQGADRVKISGPDVREVQVSGGTARVFLRGAITQRTRLAVSFEVPRAKTGRMSLPAFGVQGASNRGGTLVIAGGGGAVLLEMESPGLTPMALHDLPDSVRGLLAAPPVYGYRLGGGSWEARIDVVDLAEFKVRETLVDAALYTVLFRPDGSVMTKVLYEVRNRGQQYMRVDLPAGAQLLLARVAEQQKSMARGPDEAIYVPLEKSVLTTAGLVSFPVELVYVMKAPPLARQGRLSLPLPRTDLPVAYARCALSVPDGLKIREWHGTLQQVPSWSSETAEREFEYGTGHLAVAPKPEPARPRTPATAPAPRGGPAQERRQQGVERGLANIVASDEDQTLTVQEQTLQAKNFYRAGVDFYSRGNYQRAKELFQQSIQVSGGTVEADNAKRYLGNIDIALGADKDGEKGDRSARATAKAVKMSQQGANVDVVQRQHELVEQAEEYARQGDVQQAEAAYRVVVGLGRKLQERGEAAAEQEAVTRKARQFLEERGRGRQDQAKQVAQLQGQVQALRQSIGKQGGEAAQQVAEALVLDRLEATDQPAPRAQEKMEQKELVLEIEGVPSTPQARQGTPALRAMQQAARMPAPAAPQVQAEEALAEQQVAMAGKGKKKGTGALTVGGGGGAGFGGAAYGNLSDPAARGYDYAGVAAGDRLQRLQQQVEELKAIQQQLGTEQTAAGGDVMFVGQAPPYGKPSSSSLSLRVAEKAKGLGAQAERATQLAQEGRLAEARQLIENLEKEQEVTARAAQALAQKPADKPPALVVAPKHLGDLDVGTGPAADVRKGAGGFLPGITGGRAAVQPGEQSRQVATPPTHGDGTSAALTDVRSKLAKARTALESNARLRDNVQFDITDITEGAEDGKRLAEFVASNYKWALQAGGQRGGQTGGQAAPNADGQTFTAGTVAVGTGKLNLNAAAATQLRAMGNQGITSFYGNLDDASTLRVTSTNNLVIANDAKAVEQVQVVLERLRANLGQSVQVGSRNVFVDPKAARVAGIQWKAGVNGVLYAVVNEGQLLGLMDVEQRAGNNDLAAALPHEARQDAVVGTQALIANGAVVAVSGAADTANTLDYNGNTLAVGHDDYLLINNGTFVTAVKSGRMQHWAAEAVPVRFPGVPAVIDVPAVGRVVKFEKTLLDPSDSLELVTEYTWQGEEK